MKTGDVRQGPAMRPRESQLSEAVKVIPNLQWIFHDVRVVSSIPSEIPTDGKIFNVLRGVSA